MGFSGKELPQAISRAGGLYQLGKTAIYPDLFASTASASAADLVQFISRKGAKINKAAAQHHIYQPNCTGEIASLAAPLCFFAPLREKTGTGF